MASKAARRRKRERERRRADAAAFERMFEENFACAEADLASVEGLIDEVDDLLIELFDAARYAHERWPQTPETDELCAVFETVKAAVRDCGSRLGAVRTRAAQCRNDELHLHVARGQVERMVRVDEVRGRAGEPPPAPPDDDIPFCPAEIACRAMACRRRLHGCETLRGIRLSAFHVRALTNNPWRPRSVAIFQGSADTPGAMNDFHIALLWLRSLEIVIGHSAVIMLSELEMHDLFVRYRSPYKA